ncbi:hypothetical protein ILYODFUR_031760 [Ilyodon furcidens]|uniref:Uncharacterized protein n=1 Tax=Ilyodon furcidens TaxID=33524 RepID=A0ABV0TS53_9TELE
MGRPLPPAACCPITGIFHNVTLFTVQQNESYIAYCLMTPDILFIFLSINLKENWTSDSIDKRPKFSRCRVMFAHLQHLDIEPFNQHFLHTNCCVEGNEMAASTDVCLPHGTFLQLLLCFFWPQHTVWHRQTAFVRSQHGAANSSWL